MAIMALFGVGMDIGAGAVWMEYIAFLKAAPVFSSKSLHERTLRLHKGLKCNLPLLDAGNISSGGISENDSCSQGLPASSVSTHTPCGTTVERL